jgi:hypothetical protein
MSPENLRDLLLWVLFFVRVAAYVGLSFSGVSFWWFVAFEAAWAAHLLLKK